MVAPPPGRLSITPSARAATTCRCATSRAMRVGRSAGRERHDQLDRAARIGLRHGIRGIEADASDRRDGHQRGFACCSSPPRVAAHSPLMLAVFATFAHFSVSAAKAAKRAAGDQGRTSAPSLAKRLAMTSGAVRLALIARSAADDGRSAGRSNHADIGQHHVVGHRFRSWSAGRGRAGCAPRSRPRAPAAVPSRMSGSAARYRRRTYAPVRPARRSPPRRRPCRGMCTMSVPVLQLEQFGARWVALPWPAEPKLSLPGLALA